MNISFESILFIVVLLLLSGVSNWLQKRRQSTGEETPGRDLETGGVPVPPTVRRGIPPSRPTTPSAPAPSSRSWEEELRRLLEGEPPVITAPPPAPPAAPPPPPPVARPVSQPRPVVVVTPIPPPPRPASAPRPPQLPVVVPAEAEEGALNVLARMGQSEAAMSRAGQLHADVARRLRHVDEMTERHQVRTAGDRVVVRSPEARAARVLLQNPRTARQAIVASVVLGAPKAFESGCHPLV